MLFDGLPAELPTATLRAGAAHARHRVISSHLSHWLVDRWAWLRPRTVPLIAAFVGMLAVLGATKYLSAYARGDDQRSAVIYVDRPSTRWLLKGAAPSTEISPDQIHIAPVRPGSHDVTITLTQ
jgi:hypothetical protein